MKYKLFPPQAIYELGQRSNQEDNIFPAMGQATADDRLFIVCDGMGGHEHGEVASQAVATTIGQTLTRALADEPRLTDDSINRAIAAAYERLDQLDRGEARKMGTTLTLLCLHRGGVTAAHIGDSRIYHLRPATGEVRYLSRDHSLVMDLYQAGEITRDEMRTSPQKNVITRAMTPGKDDRTRADIVHIADVQPGDYFYLCSDGMLEQMEDDDLLALVSDNTTDTEKREALIRATIANKDNHSAYLIHVEQVTREQGDEALADDEMTTRYNAMNIYREREAQDASDVSIVAPPKFRPREITVDATGALSSPPEPGRVGGGMTVASAATGAGRMDTKQGEAGGGMKCPNGLLNRKNFLLALAALAVIAATVYFLWPSKPSAPTTPMGSSTPANVGTTREDSIDDDQDKTPEPERGKTNVSTEQTTISAVSNRSSSQTGKGNDKGNGQADNQEKSSGENSFAKSVAKAVEENRGRRSEDAQQSKEKAKEKKIEGSQGNTQTQASALQPDPESI